MSKPKQPRRWRTAGGVVVEEVVRGWFYNRRGRLEEKILGRRLTGGSHGWLWLRNLTEVKP